MDEPKAYLKHRGKLEWLFKFLFKPTIVGAENIPESGRVIIAGNHTHFMDCISVAASTKRVVHFLGKSELLEPPLRRYFAPFGVIPVHRERKDKAALDSAIEVLEDDKVIGIFPEGTRSANGKIGRFKRGAFTIARDLHFPIIPVSISGANNVLPKGGWYITPSTITMTIHQPINTTNLNDDNLNEMIDNVKYIVEKDIKTTKR